MSVLAPDTHAYVKRLKEAGFSEQQAEVLAETQAELITDQLASKHDIENVRTELKRDIETLRADLKHDLKELELRLTIKLGAMLAIAVGAVATLVKLL